jgi:hypothetical protein
MTFCMIALSAIFEDISYGIAASSVSIVACIGVGIPVFVPKTKCMTTSTARTHAEHY